jgi:hypothetical protein
VRFASIFHRETIILLLIAKIAWLLTLIFTGFLTAAAPDDWNLVLEVCERASASESAAKEAAKALRREFRCVCSIFLFPPHLMGVSLITYFSRFSFLSYRYGEPSAQLSAARLWAIMLQNANDTFICKPFFPSTFDVLSFVLESMPPSALSWIVAFLSRLEHDIFSCTASRTHLAIPICHLHTSVPFSFSHRSQPDFRLFLHLFFASLSLATYSARTEKLVRLFFPLRHIYYAILSCSHTERSYLISTFHPFSPSLSPTTSSSLLISNVTHDQCKLLPESSSKTLKR